MKRTLMIVGLLFAASVFAKCPPDTVDNYANQFMSKLQQKTELTAEQKGSLKNALKSNICDREDILLGYEGQKGLQVKRKIQTQLEGINANLQSEAKDILTPEQYGEFLNVQGENQAAIRERVKANY